MKSIIIGICLLALSVPLSAQVNYDLNYEPGTKVYTLSLLPESTWSAPQNLVGSAQIVLRVAADKDFTPGITSLIDGLVWADNAYLENPAGADGYTFVCISLVNGPTSKIKLVSGEPTPLFSFVNSGGGCAGEISLLSNDDPMVQAVRAGGFNVTQHLAVLGARGNAFRGLGKASVDCSALTDAPEAPGKIIDEVKLSPVPADKTVTLQWSLLSDEASNQEIVICDALGREVFREKAGTGKGRHTRDLQVENWPAGLYRLRFALDHGHQTQSWNVMVVH